MASGPFLGEISLMISFGPFHISPLILINEEIDETQIISEIKRRIAFFENKRIARQEAIALKASATLDTLFWMYACFFSGRIFVPLTPDLNAEELLKLNKELPFHFISPNQVFANSSNAPFEWTKEEEILTIIHSSGSEGRPKPIPLTLENFIIHTQGHALHNNQTQQDIWLASLPFYHIGGVCLFVRALFLGQKIIFDGKFNLEKTKFWLKDQRLTALSLVPTMLYRLMREKDFSFTPQLKLVLIGGAALDPDLEKEARSKGLPITTTYGMTEACSQVVTGGKALPHVTIKISADSEILVSTRALSPQVKRDAEGFFATGDLGTIDHENILRVWGRKKNLIISGGENFFPEEIEFALLSHPLILEAAVWGKADLEWGEIICAAYVLNSEAKLTNEELKFFLREKISAKKLPKKLIEVNALPKTSNGKIKRAELKNLIPN